MFKSWYTEVHAHPAAAHLAHFTRRFKLKFHYLALNCYLQIIGSYTLTMNDTLQGVTPIPQYIQKNRVGLPGCAKNANLIEINLNELPSDVFALIPIYTDDDALKHKDTSV